MTYTTAPDTTARPPLPPHRADRATGIAGVLAMVAFAAFLAVSSSGGISDIKDRSAIQTWLTHRDGAGHAVLTLTVSSLSYLPLIVFLGGLRTLVRRWDPSGVCAAAVGIASALFLAGALASDLANLAVPLAQHTVPGFTATVDQAILCDRMWLVALTEAQAALAAVIGTAAAAGYLARRNNRDGAPPRFLIWWGALAAAALLPLLLTTGNLTVFIASNQTRLLWILAVAIWLLLRVRRQAPRR